MSRILFLSLWTMFSASAPQAVLAQGPTDEQVCRAADTFRDLLATEPQDRAVPSDRREELARSALGSLPIDQLSPFQLATLQRHGMLVGTVRDAAIRRVQEFPPSMVREGAIVAVLRLSLIGATSTDQALRASLLSNTLEHPSLHRTVSSGAVDGVFHALAQYTADELDKSNWWSVLELADYLDARSSPGSAAGLPEYWATVRNLLWDESTGRRQIQSRLLRFGERAVARAEDDPTLLTRQELESIRRVLVDLADTGVHSSLVGKPAPELDIVWSSDPAFTGLDCLRSKVVVLHFWAMSSRASVAGIDQMARVRRLLAHHPVEVVSVTSIQGVATDADGNPVDTTSDPERELELLRDFLKVKGMRWTVIVTRQPALNPDYRVYCLPHVALIDGQRRLRYNAVNLFGNGHRGPEKIDGLVAELDPRGPAEDRGRR